MDSTHQLEELIAELRELNKKVYQQPITNLDLIQSKQIELEKKLDKLSHVVWGFNGENGLRSDTKELKTKIEVLTRSMWQATGAIAATLIGVELFIKYVL